jgi:hypothetical protein
MAQPAPGKDVKITPSQVITITLVDGTPIPSVDPATIPVGGSVEFVNPTADGIVIELFTKENNHHVAVSLFLPPSGQAILCNDPQHSSSECHYNLVVYESSREKPTDSTSGSHSIIISSGEGD